MKIMRPNLATAIAIVLALVACGSGQQTQQVTRPVSDPVVAPPPASPAQPAEPQCAEEPGMVYIAGGEYLFTHHNTRHSVAPFWIDRTEVTVAAFRAFVAAGYSAPYSSTSKRFPLTCTWQLEDNDQLPVNCVDWYQAEAFCLWSNKRIPTAIEWGWAARGREEQRKYPWGDETPSCELAVVDQNIDDEVMGCGRNRPWPVGSKPRDVTRDGVLDMLGNVSEKTSTGTTAEERSSRLTLGSSWRTAASLRFPVDVAGGSVGRDGYSDKSGIRCVKDVVLPPCARPTPASPPGPNGAAS